MSDDEDKKGFWHFFNRTALVVGVLAALATIIFPFLAKGQFNSGGNYSGLLETCQTAKSQLE